MRDRFPQSCVSRSFQDFDQWVAGFETWNLTTTQLSPGKFHGELTLAQFSDLQFIYASSNQAVQAVGSKPPKAFIFATTLTDQDGAVVSHNRRINQNVLFGLDPTRENHVITHQPCQIGMVIVNAETLQKYANLMEGRPFSDGFFKKNVISIDSEKLGNFKAYLQQLLHLLQTNSQWLRQPHAQRLIVEDCLPLLIDTLRFNLDDALPVLRAPTLRRYQMVKAMEEFMMAHITQPLTLKDLYTAAKTSPRALSYGTQDLFGMSPMDYLKVKRLRHWFSLMRTRKYWYRLISKGCEVGGDLPRQALVQGFLSQPQELFES